jgi:hypothetical protein
LREKPHRSRGDETLLAHLIREVGGQCPSCGERLDFDTALVLTRRSYDGSRPWLKATSVALCRDCV